MQTSQLENMKDQSLAQCTECGETLFDGTESYLMECDRCLSKREE
ncbi:protein YhfH [Peribacillus sp. NPDC097264]